MCIGSTEMGKAQLGQCSEAQRHSGDEHRIGEAAKGKEKYVTAEALQRYRTSPLGTAWALRGEALQWHCDETHGKGNELSCYEQSCKARQRKAPRCSGRAMNCGVSLGREVTIMENNQKSVTELIDEAVAEICFDYCKWPDKIENQDELLNKYCKNCPLQKLT